VVSDVIDMDELALVSLSFSLVADEQPDRARPATAARLAAVNTVRWTVIWAFSFCSLRCVAPVETEEPFGTPSGTDRVM